MVVHRKDIKKQNVKNQKIFFFRKDRFSENNPKDRIKYLTKKTKERHQKRNLKTKKYIFFKKSFRPKTIPKIVSKLVHRKDSRKRKLKVKKLQYFVKRPFFRKYSQRSYQWAYTKKA